MIKYSQTDNVEEIIVKKEKKIKMNKVRKLITNNQHVVLASQSLARINYLRDSGIKFEVRPHAVVESEIKKKRKSSIH